MGDIAPKLYHNVSVKFAKMKFEKADDSEDNIKNIERAAPFICANKMKSIFHPSFPLSYCPLPCLHAIVGKWNLNALKKNDDY